MSEPDLTGELNNEFLGLISGHGETITTVVANELPPYSKDVPIGETSRLNNVWAIRRLSIDGWKIIRIEG